MRGERTCEICEIDKAKHKCLCSDCEKIHFICEECYQEGKKEGVIIDKGFRMKQYMKEIKEKYK